MKTRPTTSVDIFREFSRRHGQAIRKYDNARATESSADRADAALSEVQALEAEFALCFEPVRAPNWEAVEAMARGDARAA